jgi:tetrahydromethanopterin S-methyltransferase subunit G
MTEDTSQNTFEQLLDAALDRQLESERAVRDVLEEVRTALARLEQAPSGDADPSVAHALEGLRQELRSLGERPESDGASPEVVEALNDVRDSLRVIESSAGPAGPGVESTLDEIRRVVNILADRPVAAGGGEAVDLAPVQSAFHTVMDRIDALEEGMRAAPPLDEAAIARLDALEGRLSTTLPSSLDEAAISQLHSRLDAIEDRLVAPASAINEAALERIDSRLDGVEDRIESLVGAVSQASARSLDPATVGAIDSILAGLEELRGQMAELGMRVVGRAGVGDEEAEDDLRILMEASAEDVRGLAQAMLDLNTGLRSWAERIDERISALARSVLEAIRDLASAQKEAFEDIGRSVTSSGMTEEVRDAVRATTRTLAARLKGLEERVVEAGDLSRYLKDQIEDLDRVLGVLTAVPEKIDGVVAQAVRRATTARAGLAQQAQKALEQVLGPVGGDLERFAEVLRGAAEAAEGGHLADEVRRIALHQVELTSRLEALQETIASSLDSAEESQRSRDEAMAKALDRAGRGLDPKAVESIRARTQPAKPRRTAARSRSGSSTGKRKTAARKAKTSGSSTARRGRSGGSKKSSS